MQQMWTVLQCDGTIHLGLWLMAGGFANGQFRAPEALRSVWGATYDGRAADTWAMAANVLLLATVQYKTITELQHSSVAIQDCATAAPTYEAFYLKFPTWPRYSPELQVRSLPRPTAASLYAPPPAAASHGSERERAVVQDWLAGLLEMADPLTGRPDGMRFENGWPADKIQGALAHRLTLSEALTHGWLSGRSFAAGGKRARRRSVSTLSALSTLACVAPQCHAMADTCSARTQGCQGLGGLKRTETAGGCSHDLRRPIGLKSTDTTLCATLFGRVIVYRAVGSGLAGCAAGRRGGPCGMGCGACTRPCVEPITA